MLNRLKNWYMILPSGLKKILFSGKKAYCPVCKTNLAGFFPGGETPRKNARCPVCGCLERDRFFILFLREKTDIFQTGNLRLLHFAPESQLANVLKSLPKVLYLSADLNSPLADEIIDITEIPKPSKSFDRIICKHVMEHIVDDRKAFRELYRVLDRGGELYLMVPVEQVVTIEDPLVTSPAERLKLFGQIDHVRVYGWDIIDRIQSAGFVVEKYNSTTIASACDIKYYGLLRNDFVFVCRKIDK